jgi:TPR repeat protein
MRWIKVLICGCTVLGGCANPLNEATSQRYADTCAAAEKSYQLDVAEQACYRALVNVDWGNLGPDLKSIRLYNLGRIKRQLSKYAEAEDLFRQSLALEEKLPSVSEPRISRRLVELANVLAAQGKWTEGAALLERAGPMANQLSAAEKVIVGNIFAEYAKHFRATDQPAVAERFETEAVALNPAALAATEADKASPESKSLYVQAAKYEDGNGVPKDMAKAIALYRESAELGNVSAQAYLGVIYDKARGVPQDDVEALKWYRLAADKGEPQSQFNLGVFLIKGRGTSPNEEEGWSWIRKAAASGHLGARAALARAGK